MKFKDSAMLAMAVGLVFLTGCFGTRLGAADDGTTVTAKVGAMFTVTLASNPTTGFEWQLAEMDTTILENTDQRYVPDATSILLVGAGGTEVWEFVARSAGTTTLRLEYRRPFESQELDPDDSFEVTVVVTPAE